MNKMTTLFFATIIWLPSIHFFFSISAIEFRQEGKIAPKAKKLAEQHLQIWRSPELRRKELNNMQLQNPEWDFMSRTYFVLSLANMALIDPSYTDLSCDIIDDIIQNTIEIEQQRGNTYFLMGYAHSKPWIHQPPRSIFIDGEIALMIAARLFVRSDTEHNYDNELKKRVHIMLERMSKSPVLSAESYPDECWLFCNTVALAVIRMHDKLYGTDHSTFLERWVDIAKEKLENKSTGMLISSYEVDGKPAATGRCPEGSSIFMASHMLQIVDPQFASDQYQRAKTYLVGSAFGFGYAREWSKYCVGYIDIDSGPIVPFIEASASASGMAILGATSFDDEETLVRLLRSLEFMGFPIESEKKLVYQASNPVGDAVLLYAMVQGALWSKVLEGTQ